jgi:toxin-antitoxin system PIN domain toxin
VKLPDLNILVNALNPDAEAHDVCRVWLQRNLSGAAPVGFAWLVMVGVVRLTTMPQIFADPLSSAEATGWVRTWLEQPPATVLNPGPRHLDLFTDMLDAAGRAGNLVNDAHLAALALEHRATIVTFDSDFARFPGVRWERPAVEA